MSSREEVMSRVDDMQREQHEAIMSAPYRDRLPGHRGGIADTLTDGWAADKVAAKLTGRICHVPAQGLDLVWDRACWRPDEVNAFPAMIEQALRSLARETHPPGGGNEAQKKQYARYRKTAQTVAYRDRIMKLVRERLSYRPDELDSDPELLATPPKYVHLPSDTVNLRTGELQRSRPGDLNTQCAGVAPEPGEPTRWLSLLDHAFQSDPDMIEFHQRICGYAMTGHNREKIAFFYYGPTDTAKSQVNRMNELVLGSYFVTIPTGTLIGSRGGRHPTDLAAIAPARLAAGSEAPERASHWDSQTFKQITGGDTMQVRAMREDFYSIEPRCKLLFFANHIPSTTAGDRAMLRRLVMIPLTHQVPREDQIPELADRIFEAEGGKVLSWYAEGARKYLAHGLGELPAVVKQATAEYAESEDLLGQFVEEACLLGDGLEDTRKNLFHMWRGWCTARGDKSEVGTQTAFTRMLNSDAGRLGLKPTRIGSNSLRGFAGIQVQPLEDFTAEPDISPEKINRKAASNE